MPKKKILIIDNELDIVNPIAYMLQARNYVVNILPDGKGAVERVKKDQPDLILFDIMTPGSDGYELCSRLKSEKDTRHIPIIVITAKGERDVIVRCFSCGINDYIVKPFNINTLLGKMRRFVS